MGVPASQRLRKQSDFRQIRSQGKRIHCGSFIFQCLQRDASTPAARRLSVIASRRVGNAIKRTYGKRMLREIFRKNQEALPTCSDVVIVLRASFDTQTYAQLEARYLKACATIVKMAEATGNGAPQ
ncbi:MAG TPA: ribonuclease P protein component [Opitutae bacterium]|nr:ribonuclease P protein component [Opitutae bacterium]